MSEHKQQRTQRHNTFITTTLDASGQFTSVLMCPFIPDEVKVRGISFFNTVAVVNGVFSIHVDSLGYGGSPGGTCLGSFIDPSISYQGIVIQLPTWTNNSTHTFRILLAGLPTAVAIGTLNLHLEWRKF